MAIELTDEELRTIRQIYSLKHIVEIKNWYDEEDGYKWTVCCETSKGVRTERTAETLLLALRSVILDTLFDIKPTKPKVYRWLEEEWYDSSGR